MAASSSNVKVKREKQGTDDDDIDPVDPAPSSSRLATIHSVATNVKDENYRHSRNLPFRDFDWDEPSSLHRGSLLQQYPSITAVSHGHPSSIQPTPQSASFPSSTSRFRSASDPSSEPIQSLSAKIKDEAQEEGSTTTTPGQSSLLSQRRSSLRSKGERMLRKKQKQEWKMRLELEKEKFGEEQESLLSAAREKFSPDPILKSEREG